MEVLEKLEKVQRAMQLLHSIGISDSDNDAIANNPHPQRFLADFTSLLMQDYGELDITSKCQLITTHISKISSLFLGDALHSGAEGRSWIQNAAQNNLDKKRNADSSGSFSHDAAMVGLDAMIRSNSTLEDFCRSYFMFHKMDVNLPQLIFRYLPMLSFTETYIYQLDALNEKLLQLRKDRIPALGRNVEYDDRTLSAKYVRTFGRDPFRPLLTVLESRGLLTERIKEELRRGEEYWALERKLCCALVCKKEISIEDVKMAIHLKSFDYRVLNLLLYQLRGEEVNELHMEFLSVSELLVEVSDDLFDYEDDVVENNFNVLRMFVKCYGASVAPIMLAKFITEAEERYDQLLNALGPELSTKYWKRCEEATKEGGKTLGPSLGTWVIPPVIEDETSYRTTSSTSNPDVELRAGCVPGSVRGNEAKM